MVDRRVPNGHTSPERGRFDPLCPASLGIGPNGEISLLEVVPDAVLTTDRQGRITLANQRASEMFGATNSELIGRPVEDLLPAGRRERHNRHRQRYARAPRPRAMHTVADLEAVRLDNGTTFPVDVTLSPATVRGEPVVVATIRHLSTTTGCVPALPLDEGHAEVRWGSTADAVVRTGPDGRITWVSAAIGQWLGIDPAELPGRPIRELILDDSRDGDGLTRLTHTATTHRRTTSGRILMRSSSNPEGTWAAVDIVPLVNTHCRVDGLVLSLRDTDALTRAQLARERSEEVLRLAIEHSPIGTIQATPDGRIFKTNRAMRLLVASQPDRLDEPNRLIGTRLADLTLDADAEMVAEGIRACGEADDGTWQAEIDLHRGPRKPARVKLHLCLIRRPDRTPDHLLSQCVDLTAEQELVANIARSNADLQRYAHLASHDLQAPLRKLANVADTLLAELDQSQLTDDQLLLLESIRDTSRDMGQLVRDMLQLCRVDLAGPSAQNRASFDSDCQRAIERLQADIEESNAEIVIDAGCRDTTVALPAGQLVAALQNLIQNSLRFRSPARRPRITVSCKPKEAEMIEIKVVDNGRGIAPDLHDKIFEFGATGPDSDGTGAGLALVKRIVENQGGQIDVSSDGFTGTTMTMSLPHPSEVQRSAG